MFHLPDHYHVKSNRYEFECGGVTIMAKIERNGVLWKIKNEKRYPTMEEIDCVSLMFWDEGDQMLIGSENSRRNMFGPIYNKKTWLIHSSSPAGPKGV